MGINKSLSFRGVLGFTSKMLGVWQEAAGGRRAVSGHTGCFQLTCGCDPVCITPWFCHKEYLVKQIFKDN